MPTYIVHPGTGTILNADEVFVYGPDHVIEEEQDILDAATVDGIPFRVYGVPYFGHRESLVMIDALDLLRSTLVEYGDEVGDRLPFIETLLARLR
jgi:hypothetical protein